MTTDSLGGVNIDNSSIWMLGRRQDDPACQLPQVLMIRMAHLWLVQAGERCVQGSLSMNGAQLDTHEAASPCTPLRLCQACRDARLSFCWQVEGCVMCNCLVRLHCHVGALKAGATYSPKEAFDIQNPTLP